VVARRRWRIVRIVAFWVLAVCSLLVPVFVLLVRELDLIVFSKPVANVIAPLIILSSCLFVVWFLIETFVDRERSTKRKILNVLLALAFGSIAAFVGLWRSTHERFH
jgi:hypothetical protein